MKRPILLFALAAAFFTMAAGAEETKVYKTKNADGTTTYSQTASDGAEERVMHSSGASTKVDNEAAAAPTPDEIPTSAEATAASKKEACDAATANLAVLQTGQVVTRTNAAGETETLSAEEAAASRVEAEQQVNAYCKDNSGA